MALPSVAGGRTRLSATSADRLGSAHNAGTIRSFQSQHGPKLRSAPVTGPHRPVVPSPRSRIKSKVSACVGLSTSKRKSISARSVQNLFAVAPRHTACAA